MNIHLPAILGFTRYQGFDPSPSIFRLVLMLWCFGDTMGQQDSQNNAQALKLKEELEHGTLTAMNRELGIFDFNHEHRSCFFWVLILKPHQDICVIFACMHPPEHTWWPLLRSKLGIAPLVNGSDNEKVAAPKSLYFLGILKSLNCQGETLPKRPKWLMCKLLNKIN